MCSKETNSTMLQRKSLILHIKSALRIPATIWFYLKKSYILFCANTQVHGYKYLVLPHRPWAEKFLWAIFLFSISAFTTGAVLYMYIPFLNTPTLTTELPDWIPINQIPLPAIAFCPNNRISRRALLNYSKLM